jgi:hypothetical protein
MKGILEFNLEDSYERLAHKRAVNATAAYLALWDIGQEVFRPARKHGYLEEPRLNELLRTNQEDNEVSLAVSEAITILEKRFYGILEKRGINLDDVE